jgi:serine/threonine protein kinase
LRKLRKQLRLGGFEELASAAAKAVEDPENPEHSLLPEQWATLGRLLRVQRALRALEAGRAEVAPPGGKDEEDEAHAEQLPPEASSSTTPSTACPSDGRPPVGKGTTGLKESVGFVPQLAFREGRTASSTTEEGGPLAALAATAPAPAAGTGCRSEATTPAAGDVQEVGEALGLHSVTVGVPKAGGDGEVVFRVPEHFRFVGCLGLGAYGSVAAFRDTSTGQQVAVKRCTLREAPDSMRIAREVRILLRAVHRNIVGMRGAYCDGADAYILQELMGTNLNRIIQRENKRLTYKRCKQVMHETLGGLSYLHSLGVVHRDLKPANILVSTVGEAGAELETWVVKLCDFNLSRGGLHGDHGERQSGDLLKMAPWRRSPAEEAADDAELSDYVCTRWYRAPEVALLKAGSYGKPMDIWAAGCIWCELLTLTVFFPGKDSFDQLRKIFTSLGQPTKEDFEGQELRKGAGKFLGRLSARDSTRKEWSSLLPGARDEATRAAKAMLHLDHRQRPSAEECMSWRCFSGSMPGEEEKGEPGVPMDWSFDVQEPSSSFLRSLISVGVDLNEAKWKHGASHARRSDRRSWAELSDD